MQLRGVHHISLNVSDTEVAERFYTEVLGLEKIPRPDFGFPGSWLACADGRQVHLLEVEGWVPPKGQHFAFAVDDLDAVRDDLAARGVKVSEPNGITGTGRQSFFKDPCGNLIEINEPAAVG
jgi:catechol 2,3-dioxygenase-like lactoylglutathione lyase family enzyme